MPLNGRRNNFMMLPSNIYLYPKIMFYTFTGRVGGMDRRREQLFENGKKKKKRKESLLDSFST